MTGCPLGTKFVDSTLTYCYSTPVLLGSMGNIGMSRSDDANLKLDQVVHEMASKSFEEPARSVDHTPLGSVNSK